MTAAPLTSTLPQLPAFPETSVQAELERALDRLEPDVRHVCGYAVGLWDQTGAPTSAGGKGIRGTLALLSARAATGNASAGLPAAVAVELVHNFSLVHDDLMDGDRLRRHRPTVWAAFGPAQAILAGDAMLGLAAELLAEAGASWAVQCLAATTRRLINGQVADLAFERRRAVSLAECLKMSADKTGSLLACAASLGTVVANGPADLACRLASYGMHVGLAFQLTDDLLGIWGDPRLTGKPVRSDLRAHKKSLPVVAALQNVASAAGQRLAELYLTDEPPAEDQLTEIAALVEAAGGRAWAEQTAATELTAALQVLSATELPDDVSAELRQLATQLAGRER